MESYSRIRSVKLKRESPDEPFGFSVRGGHEHGTGIFVSHVEPRSWAHKARLKVGDQILRLNGFPVSAAVHNECLALMRFRTSLRLKVRSVGMIPVREKTGDPLTWKLVEEPPLLPIEDPAGKPHGSRNQGRPSHFGHSRHSGSDSSSHLDSRLLEAHGNETKVFIDISGHAGLGCCICKGPPERPGIFVQSTKSNGVAREAGLRPGDQIIQCNGHSFLNIPFAEAVYHLKVSKHLDLVVVKGAASDLFPGESSGYNSSASSLNGDTHISASSISSSSNNPVEMNGEEDHHYRQGRLPLVSEERRPSSKGSSNSDGDGIVLDRHIEWNEVEESWKEAENERLVIQIRAEEDTVKSNTMVSSVRIMENKEEKRLLEERKKLLEDQRRLLEEAVKFEEEKRRFEAEKRQLEMLKTSLKPVTITEKSPEEPASSEAPPVRPQNTLAGQLHKEILKRVERQREHGAGQEKGEDEKPKPGTVDQKISLFANTADAEKRQQHEQLIKEFKRAHRKMFAHSLEQIEVAGEEIVQVGSKTYGAKRIQKEVEHEKQMVLQQVQGIVRQRQLRIERQHQECQETEREVGQKKGVFRSTKSPPPPPPVNGVDARTSSGSSKWTTLSIKLPSGNGASPVQNAGKDGNQPTNGVQSSEGTKKAPNTVKIQNHEEDIPESPSPDYSNSPSPTPAAENQWDERVSANGKMYNRNGPTKFGFPPNASVMQHQKESKHGNKFHSSSSTEFQSRSNMATKHDNNNSKSKDSEITTSGNGKVTIIVGDPNNHYNMGSINTQSSHSSKSVKSNGGILKMANGNCNVNDHSVGNLPQKTISFGEF